jgi:hypothetical protein
MAINDDHNTIEQQLWSRFNADFSGAAGVCPDDLAICGFVDGTLSEEEQAGVDLHLLSCDSCLDAVRDLRSILGHSEDVPKGLEEKVLEAVHETLPGRTGTIHRFPKFLAPVAIAACVLIALAFLLSGDDDESAPPPTDGQVRNEPVEKGGYSSVAGRELDEFFTGMDIYADGTVSAIGVYTTGDEKEISAIWNVQYDADGTLQQQNSYRGRNFSFIPYAIRQLSDGSSMFVGTAGRVEVFRAGTVVGRISRTGELEYMKFYSGEWSEESYSLIETEGGVMVVGLRSLWQPPDDPNSPRITEREPGANGYCQLFIMKVLADGSVAWRRYYDASNPLEIALFKSPRPVIRPDGNGGGYVASGTDAFGAGELDGWLMHVTADGRVDWQYAQGGFADETYLDVSATRDGGCIAIGSTASYGVSNGLLVVRNESDGSVRWSKQYRVAGMKYLPQRILADDDGGFVICGGVYAADKDHADLLTLKIDAEGSVLWYHAEGSDEWDFAFDMRLLGDGSVLMAGGTHRDTGRDAWLRRLSPPTAASAKQVVEMDVDVTVSAVKVEPVELPISGITMESDVIPTDVPVQRD